MDIVVASIASGIAGVACGLAAGILASRKWGRLSSASLQDSPSSRHSLASEQSLLQAQLDAELASRAKDDFLASMSHEIRTPLTAILGFTDLLLRGGEDEATRREYLTLIRNSGKSLLELINDILDLSKIKAGKMKIRPVECSIHEVVRDAVALHRVTADQKGLSLKYVWNGAIPKRVRTDPARFRQMVTNLVGNALKFTEKGGVTVALEMIETTEDGNPQSAKRLLAVRVTDTGIGISQDKIRDIFEPFNQANTSVTRRFGGTGLGLTITRQIATAMGGKLTVTSRLGEGSTFTASIDPGPLDGVPMLEEMPQALPATGDEPRAAAEESLQGIRVFLVEDGAMNRQLITAMLTRAGAEVVTAENGRQAVDRALSESFDIILMDMQMPVLDGFRATEELRQKDVTVPIVALTAHAMKDELDRCLQAGCNSYLSKPVEISALLRMVRATVMERRPADAPAKVSSPYEPEPPSDAVFSENEDFIHSSLPTDDPEFAELVSRYVPTLKQSIRDLRAVFDKREITAVRQLAHSLKGTAGSFGFGHFTEPAQRLSAAMRETDWTRAAAAMAELERMAKHVVDPKAREESSHAHSN